MPHDPAVTYLCIGRDPRDVALSIDRHRDRFWQWVDDETPTTLIGSSLRRTVEHLQTFRDAAEELDVVSLHYDDLQADLEGQMRQLASRLGIHVDEHR